VAGRGWDWEVGTVHMQSLFLTGGFCHLGTFLYRLRAISPTKAGKKKMFRPRAVRAKDESARKKPGSGRSGVRIG
jgi:hypothetical protein